MGGKIRVRFGNRKRFQFGAAELFCGKVRGRFGRRHSFKRRPDAVGALNEGFGLERSWLAIQVEREPQGGGQGGGRCVGRGPLDIRGIITHGCQGKGEGAAENPIGHRGIGEWTGAGGRNPAQFALVGAQGMDFIGDLVDIKCAGIGGRRSGEDRRKVNETHFRLARFSGGGEGEGDKIANGRGKGAGHFAGEGAQSGARTEWALLALCLTVAGHQ